MSLKCSGHVAQDSPTRETKAEKDEDEAKRNELLRAPTLEFGMCEEEDNKVKEEVQDLGDEEAGGRDS